MSAVPMLIGQATTLTPTFKDGEGNSLSPADNTIVWNVNNVAVATLAPDTDAQTAVLTAVADGTAVVAAIYKGISIPFTATVTGTTEPVSGTMANTSPA